MTAVDHSYSLRQQIEQSNSQLLELLEKSQTNDEDPSTVTTFYLLKNIRGIHGFENFLFFGIFFYNILMFIEQNYTMLYTILS